MKVLKVVSTRKYKAGYEVREELIDGSEYGSEDLTMKVAYTPDGNYIGDSKWGYRLCKKWGIKPELASPDNNVCSIGFCETEQKWYGWSHRAMYGFEVGATVAKGDCAYTPATVDELFDSITIPDEDGWAWQKAENVEKIRGGVRIKHKMVKHTTENAETGELTGWVEAEPDYQVIMTGRGEWTAQTLVDARLMAIDFASGVR